MKDIEKIYKVLEIKGIKPTKAERLLGLSQGTLTKSWERKGNIHDTTREKFLEHFLVNRTWWDTGEGDIFDKKGTSVKEYSMTEEVATLVSHFNDTLEGYRQDIERLKQEKRELEEKLNRTKPGKD